MLFLDNAAPDSDLMCRAPLAHTHISTFGIYSSHGSRENVGTETQTDRSTDYKTLSYSTLTIQTFRNLPTTI